MEVRNISLIEMDAMHNRLLTLFLSAGLEQGPVLDKALGDAMTTVLTSIDEARQSRIDAKAKLKLVD